LTRLGLGPREAGIAILAVGLGLFWLTDQLVLYAVPSVVDGTWQPFDDAWAFDLAAYVHAAHRLVNDGSLYRAELVAGPFEPGSADLFMYPPPFGVAMLALREPPFREAALMWWAMHIAAMLLACALMPVRPILRAVAFAVLAFSWPGVKDPVLGNVSTLLLPLLVVAWRWIDRPIASVAIAISASVRPSLGILILWQLLRRQWRLAVWTVFAGGALFLGTLPFVGLDGYRDFVAVFRNLTPPTGISENRDLGGFAIGLGAEPAVTGLVRMFSTLVAVSAILLGLRRDRELGYMVTLCASLLLVPLLWDHYLATIVLPATLLAQRWHPALILLPLLSWLPVVSAPLVLVTMILALLSPGPTPGADVELTSPGGLPGARAGTVADPVGTGTDEGKGEGAVSHLVS
jgi:hypothetical protein